MGQVNLKHLLWQLREQHVALAEVTSLRQEVLSLKLSYNAAKAPWEFAFFLWPKLEPLKTKGTDSIMFLSFNMELV